MTSEREVLANTVLHWRIYKSVPSIDELASYTELTASQVQAIWEDPQFQERLTEKGVPVDNDKLSVRQLLCLSIVMDPVNPKSLASKLDEAGINSDTWNNWLRQPKFRAAVESMGASNVSDSYPIIMQALASKAMNGNVQSAQFLMEVTGKYRREQAQDPMIMFNSMLEILTRVLAKHPEQLLQISDELDAKIVKGELGT